MKRYRSGRIRPKVCTYLLAVLTATGLLALKGAANVPLPGNPNWVPGPGPDFSVVEVTSPYTGGISKIRYGIHVYDLDTNVQTNPNSNDVDTQWGDPFPRTDVPENSAIATTRTVAGEGSAYLNRHGDLIWRVNGLMGPAWFDEPWPMKDWWQSNSLRGAVDTARDFLGYFRTEAVFTLNPTGGKIQVVVNLPNNSGAAVGANIEVNNLPSGQTDENGRLLLRNQEPQVYEVTARMGPMMGTTLVTVTAGATATAIVNLQSGM